MAYLSLEHIGFTVHAFHTKPKTPYNTAELIQMLPLASFFVNLPKKDSRQLKHEPLRNAVNLFTGYFRTFVKAQICNCVCQFVELHFCDVKKELQHCFVRFRAVVVLYCFLFFFDQKGLFPALPGDSNNSFSKIDIVVWEKTAESNCGDTKDCFGLGHEVMCLITVVFIIT